MNASILNYSHCFIIAELSANHGGKLEIALETVRAAKRAGADAIKLQTFKAETITLDCFQDDFRIKQGTLWDGRYLYELYKDGSLPWEWHAPLFEEAAKQGLLCFSSPFDHSAVDFLEQFNPPAYKIASFEITDIPLIDYVARKGKPIIISTGVAAEEDIDLAVATCRAAGNDQIALLKCTSAYPAKPEDANLIMIQDLAKRYGVVSGLSDHTLGTAVPVASVALGAHIIEKHFMLNKEVGGPDASFSLDEKAFTEMVLAVREAEKAIGKIDYTLSEKAKVSREFSRSLYISADVKSGDIVSAQNIQSVRPGYGLHPKHYYEVLGKKFVGDYKKGTRLGFELLED